MTIFKKFKRVGFSEMRPVVKSEIKAGAKRLRNQNIAISNIDEKEGSPKKGDMIARNIEDHGDQWLIAKKYFEKNFEEF